MLFGEEDNVTTKRGRGKTMTSIPSKLVNYVVHNNY